MVLGLATFACGPTGDAPEIIGLSDQTAFVGNELLLEVRASDPDLEILRFTFTSTLDDLGSRAILEHTGNGSALFRWTPVAADVGSWPIDFQVTDGRNTTTETIVIDVRAIADSAPVFRRPAAAGATLDLEENRCLELEIAIDDPDTAEVDILAMDPVIDGSVLAMTGAADATWSWCPTPAQIAQSDRHVLILGADDHDNPPTVKHFLVVLRGEGGGEAVDLGGFRLVQAGAACSFTLPSPTMVSPGGTVIIARDADRAGFESFWGVTLPASVVFVDTGSVCPQINGGETFQLQDAGGTAVEAATATLSVGTNLQRISHKDPPSDPDSWVLDATSPLGATPGTANRDVGAGVIYISEVSDALGTGNFTFEFVEISVD